MRVCPTCDGKGRLPEQKVCEQCGAGFVAKSSRARYCSPSCNHAAWRDRGGPKVERRRAKNAERQRGLAARGVSARPRTLCPECDRDVAVGALIRATGERITYCSCRARVLDACCYQPDET